ncbi:hypothetical protein ECDEC11C_5849 [Escherichia coli DEC11C]|nr:hypothetical protein ECDEC11C_5849 [Escherichia coli DEC11C]
MQCLVPPGDVNQLTINAGYRAFPLARKRPLVLTVPRALSRIHRITKFTFKKGRQSSHGVKLIPPNVTRILITEGVVAGLSLKRMVNLTTRCPQLGKE